MGAGGDVLAARGDTRSRPPARRRWKGEAMTMQDGLDIQVPQPALLFDLDGTLVDSVYQHVIAWQEALAACGIGLSLWIHRRIGMSGGLFIDALSRETGVRLDESCPGGCVSSTRRPTCAGTRPWSRCPAPASCSRACTSVRCRSRSRPAGPDTPRAPRWHCWTCPTTCRS